MRSRIYIAATAFITIAVVGWAAQSPASPATGMNPSSMVRTANERGVVSEEQTDQPGMTLEQRQLVEQQHAQAEQANGLPGATLGERQAAPQRGLTLEERGLGAAVLLGQPLDATLPETGVAPPGGVPLMIDPNGSLTTSAAAGVTTATPSAGAQPSGAPAVIVIMPSPTTTSGNRSTGTTFIDPSTSPSQLFEASQQARRESASR